MKKTLSENKWIMVVFDVIVILLGVVTVVVGAIRPENINIIISVILASILFVIGAFGLIYGFATRGSKFLTSTLIVSSIAISIGVLLCWKTNIVGNIIVYFVGALLLNIGLLGLISGIIYIVDKEAKAKNNKGRIFRIVVSFLLSAVGIATGVIIFVFGSKDENDNILRITYILAGVFVAAVGVISLISQVKLINEEKDKDKKDKTDSKKVEKPKEEETEIVDAQVDDEPSVETKEDTQESNTDNSVIDGDQNIDKPLNNEEGNNNPEDK